MTTDNTDSLLHMMKLQHELQTKTYGYDFASFTPEQRIQYIKDMKLGAAAELQEALDEVGWKPWVTSRQVNRDAYVGELVDAFQFLMNMLLALGDDPADLAVEFYTRYCVKNRINIQRQVVGYDGVSTKCPRCRRALDDVAVDCDPKPRGVGSTVHAETGDVQVIMGAWCAVSGMYDPASPASLSSIAVEVTELAPCRQPSHCACGREFGAPGVSCSFSEWRDQEATRGFCASNGLYALSVDVAGERREVRLRDTVTR